MNISIAGSKQLSNRDMNKLSKELRPHLLLSHHIKRSESLCKGKRISSNNKMK